MLLPLLGVQARDLMVTAPSVFSSQKKIDAALSDLAGITNELLKPILIVKVYNLILDQVFCLTNIVTS